jgi:hypothetical protein
MAAFATSWLVATGCVGLGFEPRAEAAVFGPNTAVSVSVFYNDLAPYGQWVDTAPYGWCWVPQQVPVVWRPYASGYWVYTDFGWAWVSDEPWGWATYHYGRWFEDPVYGWMWEPGTEWAPAWVAWRESDDWVGWAPLPPTATWSAWSGLRFEAVSIPSPSWSFVPRPRLTEASLSIAIAPTNRNVGLLSRTRDATHFALRSGRPVDEGVSLAAFERQTGRRVPHLRIVDALAPQREHGAANGAVAFYRPRVRNEPGAMPLSRAIERRFNPRVERSPIESARFQRPQEMMQRPQRPSSESMREQGRMERRAFEPPQRPSAESMREQRQAQQQAFEQRQAQQRARFGQMVRRPGPPPEPQQPARAQRGEEQRQPAPRAQRGDQGGAPPPNAQRGEQGPPPQRAERGRGQSQQSADRGNQGERKGHGRKNEQGG